MSRLRFVDLSAQSYDFVMGNIGLLMKYLLFVLPPLMAIQGYIRLEPENITYPQAIGLRLLIMIIFACFALSWHRASLMGPDHKMARRSPFRIRSRDWKFFAAFMLIALVSAVLFYAIQYVVVTKLSMFPKIYRIAGSFAALAAMMFVFYETLKTSYFLPALSMGVRLEIADVRRSSKRTIYPLMASVMLFFVIYSAVIGVYTYIALAVLSSVSGHAVNLKPVPGMSISANVTSLFLILPLYFAAFLSYAMCITALSKAYRYGIENNA